MQEENLWQRYFKNKPKAQIATLITIVIALIFLFTVITLNVGKVSQKKTAVSNAADAASLYYASQIGSYAHYLSKEFLGGKAKICKFSWSMFFKALTWGVIGAILGGWVGILFALGHIASMIAIAVGASIGFVTGGPSTYIEASAWEKITRQFKKMSAQLQFREGVILAAWMRTVDEANSIKDERDDDEDGLTDDLVSPFLVFYNDRLEWIDKNYTQPLKEAIDRLKQDMQTFDESAKAFKAYLGEKEDDFPLQGEFKNLLNELWECGYKVSFWDPDKETPLECDNVCSSADCQIFLQGCGNSEGEEDVDAPDTDCSTYSCCYENYLQTFPYDPLNILIFELDEFHHFAYGYDKGEIDETGQEVEEDIYGIYRQTTDDLVASINIWQPLLYQGALDTEEDPDIQDDTDPCEKDEPYYNVLGRWDKWIGDDYSGWIGELKWIDNLINQCVAQVRQRHYGNCPKEDYCCCRLEGKIPPAIQKLKDFQEDIKDFQEDIVSFYSIAESLESQYKEKGYYSWQDTFGKDSQGNAITAWHHVYVEVKKKIKMPYIKTYVKDFMKCAKLKNHTGEVWVSIKRYDQYQTGYPLWSLRYHKDAIDKSFDPAIASAIPAQYWISAYSKAKYSYKKTPPKIKKVQ